MSIFSRLQKALGFSYEDEGTDSLDGLLTAAVPAVSGGSLEMSPQGNSGAGVHLMESNTAGSHAVTAEEPDITLIFNGVVEFMNRELPPYIKENLDIEAQRKYIYDNIGASVQQYLRNIAENERRKSLHSRENERDKLKKNFEETKEKLRLAEAQLSDESEKALSSERQKRALNSRIKDLEDKVAALEAEREQYDLETRSLQNKLRVAEVHQANFQNLVDRLQKERDTLEEQHKISLTEIEALKAQNEQMAIAAMPGTVNTDKVESGENIQSSTEQPPKRDENTIPVPQSYELISFGDDDEKKESPQVSVSQHENTEEIYDKKELVDDTDWLLGASGDSEHPEGITTPSTKDSREEVAKGPAQLSLW